MGERSFLSARQRASQSPTGEHAERHWESDKVKGRDRIRTMSATMMSTVAARDPLVVSVGSPQLPAHGSINAALRLSRRRATNSASLSLLQTKHATCVSLQRTANLHSRRTCCHATAGALPFISYPPTSLCILQKGVSAHPWFDSGGCPPPPGRKLSVLLHSQLNIFSSPPNGHLNSHSYGSCRGNGDIHD